VYSTFHIHSPPFSNCLVCFSFDTTTILTHRDSAWREILNYFSGAAHIGLTATPKETETISSTEYFGNPIYTYSLRQGIQDGFLAPYKVLRVGLNVDLELDDAVFKN